MPATAMNHFTILTDDVPRTVRFYRDLLGLRVTDEGEDEGPELDAIVGLSGVRMRYAELDLGGGQLLELIEYVTPQGTPLAQRPCDSGASHLALRVEDVDALWERLGAAGVPVAGRPTTISAPGAWHGARCVYVEDPDGRSVELIQRP